jgi:hypothetical protein
MQITKEKINTFTKNVMKQPKPYVTAILCHTKANRIHVVPYCVVVISYKEIHVE